MRKKIIIPICVIILLFIVIYLLLDIMISFGYKINMINGRPTGIAKYYDVEHYKDSFIKDSVLVIKDGSDKLVYKYSDLGIDVEVSGYNSTKYTVDTSNMSYTIHTGTMNDIIRADLEDRLENRTEGSAGYFDVVKDEVIIVDAEQGNMFDIDSVLSYINLRIDRINFLSVDLDEFIVKQDEAITNKQKELNAIMNAYDSFSIEYTDNFVIDKNVLYKYGLLDVEDDSISIVEDEDKLIRMLVSNLVNYNSVGIDRVFKTHDGKTVTVTGGTYGNYIDYSTEAAEITPMIKDLKSESDRVPVMKQEAKFSIDTTYIEVDKAKQHVYYYEDGELVLDTDVVTGRPTPDRQTPSGVYFILNKTTDAKLIGATWNVKSDRWMGVTYQGVGFHDASWRSNFGGEIYKSNGSHGCINTPKDAMFELYDMVEEGTPVIIY